jgi:hypothetical protein
MDGHGFVDLISVALRLTRVRADPAANGGKGACKLDELQGFLKFSLDGEVHKSLDVDMCGAPYLAQRGLLFFRSRFAHHRMTAVTLLTVYENNTGLGILRNCILGTGEGTGCIFTMVTEEWLKIGSLLDHPDHSWADTQPMLLFTSHFARMATHTFNFVEH